MSEISKVGNKSAWDFNDARPMIQPPKSLDELVRPHVDSFDYFINEGLHTVVSLLKPIEVIPMKQFICMTMRLLPDWHPEWKHPHLFPGREPFSAALLLLQIEQPGADRRHRIWFENPRVSRPVKDDASGLADKRLFPRDCREAVCSMLRGVPQPAVSALL